MPRKIATIGSSSVLAQPVIRALHSYGHEIIAISRSELPALSALGVKVVVLDYSDEAGLTAALQGVHTVLSFMFTMDFDAYVSANKTLIAAMKSAGVKRFAPSEWAFTKEGNKVFSVYPAKDAVWNLAKESGLEITAYRVGQFMNYLANNSPKPNAATDGYIGVQPTIILVLDMANLKANIPGTGDEPITMTRTQDIGEFVARSVDFETWEEESEMVGDITTWNKVVDIAEKVSGKSIERTYVPIEVIEKRDELTGWDKVFMEVNYIMVKGYLNVRPTLNEKIPEVKPMKVEEFLRLWWGA